MSSRETEVTVLALRVVLDLVAARDVLHNARHHLLRQLHLQ